MSVRIRTRRTAAVLLGTALLAAAATACGPTDSSVATAPKSSAAAPAATGGEASAPAAAPESGGAGAPAVAKVGDTIALTGLEKKDTADVTLVKVVDPAESSNEYLQPAEGKRYVSVQFRIKATGSAAYTDTPATGAKLIDAQGQSFTSTFAETKAGPEFPGSVNIAPGDSSLGFVTFEIPADAKPDKVQYALNSGFAEQSGQWKLA
ncbi:DUF4352 domain-containing protein [Kitasatospora sp. NA04385]|uniref:DUF4352 domain-containing protein n=1 Tax=Kitasatospora sp. NA04385 TaxID=2742135 RepID=UPI0015913C2B|nr:DUF4352 domain-containing protein [Kitasatospora sp. NA04385]QKW21288.1 DUF4352 domain-containing protein [Kitasatospora sp. NA04385]